MPKILTTALGLTALSTSAALSASISFSDTELAAGASIAKDGLTVSTTTDTGQVSTIGAGQFTGLYLGGVNSDGNYQMTFGQAITSIEIEFDALSSTGSGPVETITNFATNLGSISISYANQFGTTFDGTTITSTQNDGQGVISFSGAAFTVFSFDHA